MIPIAEPRLRIRALHLAALTGLAIAQPIFDLLGKTPDFFIARGSTATDIVLFGLAVTIVPVALLVAAEAAVSLVSARAAYVLHLAFLFGLTAVFALQVCKRLGLDATAIALLAAVLAGAEVVLTYRRSAMRSFLSVLAAAPVFFLVVFFVRAPVDDLYRTPPVAAAANVSAKTPVVFLVLDEFPMTSLVDRQLQIDRRRFPGFADLARHSTWYRRATTVDDHTTDAVPAILTGEQPQHDALPLLSDHPRNIFTLLGGAYHYKVVESVTQLCPEDQCPRNTGSLGGRLRSLFSDTRYVYLHETLPAAMASRLPPIDQNWSGFGTNPTGVKQPRRRLIIDDVVDVDRAALNDERLRDQRERLEAFIGSIDRDDAQPTLYLFHGLLPHAPWHLLPSGHDYANSARIDGLIDDVWGPDPWPPRVAYQRHLLQTQFVDRLVEGMLQRLRREGLFDRSLIVLVADHGISFRAGDERRDVTRTNIADIAPVPLFVKLPGQRSGGIDDRNARTIDLVPTVADALNIDPPWKLDGRSLLGPPARRPDVVSVAKRDGSKVTMAGPEFRRAVAAAVRRKVGFFGTGTPLYTTGPLAQLDGREITTLRRTRPDGHQGTIDGDALFADVRPETGFVPAHISGLLPHDVAAGTPLAIAVNGVVRTTTRAWTFRGQRRYSAMLPPDAFRDGANHAAVFAVRPGRPLRLEELAHVGRATVPYRLVDGALELPQGRPAIPGPQLEGRVAYWSSDSQTIRFGGWAVDHAKRGGADRIVVFSGPRAIYEGGTGVQYWELAPGLRQAGFAVELPRRMLPRTPRLRVFAITGSKATELTYDSGFPWGA